MAYLESLNQCKSTLEQCNSNTFPRVATVIQCQKKYDLTTASDINHAQSLISREAVPFLFRQVDQLETAIETIKTAHIALEKQIDEQNTEYQQLLADESQMAKIQQQLKAEAAILAEEQTNLLNAKSLLAAKEREVAELNRTRKTTERSEVLDEAGRVDAEIIKMRRMLADIEHETQTIPTDQIYGDNDSYLVLEKLREQLALDNITTSDSTLNLLEMLENKVFVPWWDGQSNIQAERMGSITRLLKYFYKDHGSTMQAIIDVLLDKPSMSIDELRRQLSSTGHATNELPLLIGHLTAIGAVMTESNMSVQLDFSGLDG
ncbi:hypothetical protein IWW36_000901 [Coemansia brasiliensis]|uniref:Uncharacterized protein n=1 Tax=Coemansia brasiliensis TaxID=2650707 RepID=A0A9W8IAL0_9FUNG|nr:hypothetical protein IWW36_000901 [Coemansia brasiliensis]